MRYKNDDDNRYRVRFMRATEEIMDRLTESEFILYLKVNAELEDETFLKRHDVEGLATVTADKTGYFNLSIHSSGFSLYKTANDGKVCIEHVEELDLLREEDK